MHNLLNKILITNQTYKELYKTNPINQYKSFITIFFQQQKYDNCTRSETNDKKQLEKLFKKFTISFTN